MPAKSTPKVGRNHTKVFVQRNLLPVTQKKLKPNIFGADFIAKILSRITLIGALFLAFIALLPIAYSGITGLYGLSMGGTSVIIIVGVALDTAKQLESQMMMRHYKGFLD